MKKHIFMVEQKYLTILYCDICLLGAIPLSELKANLPLPPNIPLH